MTVIPRTRMAYDLDQPLVDVESDVVGCPLGGEGVEIADVDLDHLLPEFVDDRRIAVRMDAHADRRVPGARAG